MRHAQRLGNYAIGSAEWHAARAEGLGGSEIAAVLGLSPWASRFALWHRKSGLIEEQLETPAMSWGKRLEDPIAQKWADDHPEFRMRKTGTWRSKAREWQIGNPDRLLAGSRVDSAILEVKTAHGMDAHEWGESGTDQIPVYYRCQGMWYLDVFGMTTCHFAVLIGGSDYREYTITFDMDEAWVMREAAEEFLASVRDGQRPDIDESNSTYQTVRQLHPDIDGTDKEIDAGVAAQYLAACTAERSAKNWKRRASSELLDAMGTAKYAVIDGERFAMRTAVGDNTPHLRPVPRKKAAA